MNVLIVHPCKGFYGGAEEVVMQLCKYLCEHNSDVTLVTKDAPKKLIDDVIDYAVVYNEESWIGMWREIHRQWMEFDVINVYNAPASLLTFPKDVGYKYPKPIVYMCNEPMELFTNWKRKPIEAFNRWWVKKSGMKVVVADEYSRKRFKRIYGVDASIIPYGIDYKFWSSQNRNQSIRNTFSLVYGPKNKRTRLLQVGTITPYKNQVVSIEILDLLLSRGIDFSLTLAGSLPDEIYFEKVMGVAHAKGIDHRVFVKGQQTQEQIRDLYNSHDILLHPVREQGGWLVPFEACCTGIKVIVSKDFQVADFFGCHIEDIESVLNYIEAPKEDIPMHQPSPEWVRDNLSWGKFGESIVKVFEEATDENR